MDDKEKSYIQTKIDLIIEEHHINNRDFVEITDNIKIDRNWNNG